MTCGRMTSISATVVLFRKNRGSSARMVARTGLVFMVSLSGFEVRERAVESNGEGAFEAERPTEATVYRYGERAWFPAADVRRECDADAVRPYRLQRADDAGAVALR